jgi:hypothetical protein
MSHTTRSASVQRLELWQDARRIPEDFSSDAPDTFEWWYFDANLADGRAVVVTILIEPDIAAGRFVHRTTINVTRPDGPPLKGEHRTHDDVTISTEQPEVRISTTWLRGDLDTYQVFVDPAEHQGLGLDVTIERTVPGRVSPGGTDIFVGGERGLGWVNAVPRGTLGGTLTVEGQATPVRGIAYHDHNWGGVTMPSMAHHWIWGRAAIGPHTAVFASVFPTHAYRVGDAGAQSVYIASESGVLLNVYGAGAAQVTAPTAPSPGPRNHGAYYSPQVAFQIEQARRRVTLDVTPARFLHDIDMAEETNQLNAEEKARAAVMSPKPWYTEFIAAPVRMTIEDGGGDGKPEVYEGTGMIEFMDLHLYPL